jgi:hypothetical protein
MTSTDTDIYADDFSHPIPQVSTCDVKGVRKSGGADLALVVAAPLKKDDRSRSRLLKKIENYLGYVRSEDFARECGSPSPENTSITVQIHPDSDEEVFILLDESRGWIHDNHARLEIKRRANQPVQTTAITPPPSTTRGAPLSDF